MQAAAAKICVSAGESNDHCSDPASRPSGGRILCPLPKQEDESRRQASWFGAHGPNYECPRPRPRRICSGSEVVAEGRGFTAGITRQIENLSNRNGDTLVWLNMNIESW